MSSGGAPVFGFERRGLNLVGTLGHAAVAVDPVGAPLSLWQPATHDGMQLNHEPGTFARISLLTDHCAQAAAFYRPALHWNSNPQHTEFLLPDSSIAAARETDGAAITLARQFRQQQTSRIHSHADADPSALLPFGRR